MIKELSGLSADIFLFICVAHQIQQRSVEQKRNHELRRKIQNVIFNGNNELNYTEIVNVFIKRYTAVALRVDR